MILVEKAPSKSDAEWLQANLDASRARLSVAVATAASLHPVLYRFTASELIDAEKTDPEALGSEVLTRLRRSWKAAGTIKSKLLESRPASQLNIEEVTADTIPETLVARHVDGSMWKYRKLIDDGLAGCEPQAATFLKRAVANVNEAREAEESKRRGSETLETVQIVALTAALHVVCPPVALALDLATSVRDLYRVANYTEETRDEAWCYLNPRDCLIDDPPSAWPLALALAGVIMTVAL